jgi:hypothetical protein
VPRAGRVWENPDDCAVIRRNAVVARTEFFTVNGPLLYALGMEFNILNHRVAKEISPLGSKSAFCVSGATKASMILLRRLIVNKLSTHTSYLLVFSNMPLV